MTMKEAINKVIKGQNLTLKEAKGSYGAYAWWRGNTGSAW